MVDLWAVKEKLYLASAVVRCGENNWASVTKIMRNMTDTDRPAEFFSQKNCAQVYASLVESFAIPRRKRTDPSTPTSTSSSEPSSTAEQVVQKLTAQRIEELKRIIQQEQAQFRKVKNDVEMIRRGQLDHQIPVLLEQMAVGRSVATPQRLPVKDETEIARAEVSTVVTPATPASPTVSRVVSSKSVDHAYVEADRSPLQEVPKPAKEIVQSKAAGTPPRVEETSTIAGSPKTPSTPVSLNLPTEFVSPSKPPPVTMVKAATPIASPSMSPSEPVSAIQGALLSPAKSVSHSPPRSVENQALQAILQKLQAQPPAGVDSVGTGVATTTCPKQPTELAPVVTLETLPSTEKAETVELKDTKEEEKPLAKLKTPPAVTSPKSTEPTAAEPQEETVSKGEQVAREEVKVETPEKQTEKEQPPIRTLPARPRRAAATAAGKRQKQNSGGSTTSSEASGTVRSSATSVTTSSRSPMPVPPPFPDYETYKQWKKMILNVWNMAAGHRHASLFLQPVRDSIAPGYSKMVKRPVDLSMIKRNIENGTLTSTDEVRRDLLMMFANAVMYNASNTEVNQMTHEMATDVMKHLDELLVPINAMFSGGGVEATKSLRSNRQRQPPSGRR